MEDLRFLLSVEISDELTEEEYEKAENCVEILYEAFRDFTIYAKENGLVLSQVGMGYEICGAEYKEWLEQYKKENPIDEEQLKKFHKNYL